MTEPIQAVGSFCFLGSQITSKGESHQEIIRRLTLGRTAMAKLDQIWKDRDITLTTKIKLVKALVFCIVTYGAETWTVKKPDQKKIDAF